MFVARHKIIVSNELEFLIVQERECNAYDLVIVDSENAVDKERRIQLTLDKLNQYIVDTSYEFYSNWKNANTTEEKFLDRKLQILLKIHDYLRQQIVKERECSEQSRLASFNYWLIQNKLLNEIVELFQPTNETEDDERE